MGTIDPKRVKHELYSRKVMDYEEETAPSEALARRTDVQTDRAK